MTTLPQSDRALREAARFVAYRESMPAVLRPQLHPTDHHHQSSPMTPTEALKARAQAAAAANRQSLLRRTADARILDKVKTDAAKG